MPRRKANTADNSTPSFSLNAASDPVRRPKRERIMDAIRAAVDADKEWQLETVDFADPNRPLTCLEVDFPITHINELAKTEMSSGAARKPIYTMQKWWARRSSAVFRATLLAAASKAPAENESASGLIWRAYYGNHQKNDAFRKIKVADIFMGGGTTLVEGSRLGFDLFGCDLNPVAWFVVKNEITPVNLDELKSLLAEIEEEVKPYVMPYFACNGPCGEKGTWFKKADDAWQRLPQDFDIFTVSWQERPQYRYEGPEIIYTFWSKHGPCSAHGCGHRTPLMTTPVIAIKELSVPSWLDHECPECGEKFDIERFSARMAPDSALCVAKTERPFVVLDERGAYQCPFCAKNFADRAARTTGESIALGGKAGKKKISLTLLMHPQWLAGCAGTDDDGQPFGGSATDDAESTTRWYRERAKMLRVLEVRGTLPDKVTCPQTGAEFFTDERGGNIPGSGKFRCAESSCGRQQQSVESFEATGKTAPISPFVFQGFSKALDESGNPYGGRFFAQASQADRYIAALAEWDERRKGDLLAFWPQSEIPFGHMTHQRQPLPDHGYDQWWKMFEVIQRLIHSQLLAAIKRRLDAGGTDSELAEFALAPFHRYLQHENVLCYWDEQQDCLAPVLGSPNFHPKSTIIQGAPFFKMGRGNYRSSVESLFDGLEFRSSPWEAVSIEELRKHSSIEECDMPKGKTEKMPIRDKCMATVSVANQSSTELAQFTDGSFDLVITDPPFGGLLHYSELSDFFYVWLRLALKDKYPREFGPEYVPKALEAVANKARQGSDAEANVFYQRILTDCWRESHRLLKPGGILAFTFHHSEDEPWVAVLESLFDAGFYLEATYPIRSDETKGDGQFGSKQIEYDIIHVCRKRTDAPQPVSWARLRRRIAADVAQLSRMLTHHRDEGLPDADLKVIRRGKALEYFSKHYGEVYVEEGRPIDLRSALAGINQLLDDEHTPAAETPPVMAEALTRQFLRLFLRSAEMKRDEMQKTLRGTGIGPADFEKKGWCKEEKKVFHLVNPLDWARQFKGVNRKVLSRDLDQTLFLIGACYPESGIRVTDTLGSVTFRHHPAIPELLEWFTRHGPNFTFKAAAARAMTIYQDWMERNKPAVRAEQLSFDELLKEAA